ERVAVAVDRRREAIDTAAVERPGRGVRAHLTPLALEKARQIALVDLHLDFQGRQIAQLAEACRPDETEGVRIGDRADTNVELQDRAVDGGADDRGLEQDAGSIALGLSDGNLSLGRLDP